MLLCLLRAVFSSRQLSVSPAELAVSHILHVRSGRPDSNRRPPAPKAGAIPGYATPRESRTNFSRTHDEGQLTHAQFSRARRESAPLPRAPLARGGSRAISPLAT